MKIDYDHSLNSHSSTSAERVLDKFLAGPLPESFLDVGCGTGTWIAAAVKMGIKDVFGVDGIPLSEDRLLFPISRLLHRDLTTEWNLSRKFDLLVCLEVAEHLHEFSADQLIASLTAHSDRILFSAAPPNQPGQHHVNGQWPEYWQTKFNQNGFVCDDSIRWEVWNDSQIEPWYRQNLFVAQKTEDEAEPEPRIRSVIHPDAWWVQSREATALEIEKGSMPPQWYLKTPIKAIFQKLRRKCRFGTNTGNRNPRKK